MWYCNVQFAQPGVLKLYIKNIADSTPVSDGEIATMVWNSVTKGTVGIQQLNNRVHSLREGSGRLRTCGIVSSDW